MYNKTTQLHEQYQQQQDRPGIQLGATAGCGVHGAARAPRAGGEARSPARCPRRAPIHRNCDISIYRDFDNSIYREFIISMYRMFDMSRVRCFSAKTRSTHLTLRWRRTGTPGRGCGKECQRYRSPDGRPSPQPPHAQRTCSVERMTK